MAEVRKCALAISTSETEFLTRSRSGRTSPTNIMGGGLTNSSSSNSINNNSSNNSKISSSIEIESPMKKSTTFLQQARNRWSVMSFISRTTISIILSIIAFQLLCTITDFFFRYHGLLLLPDDDLTPTITTSSNYAVVINTYKRPDMLKDAVQHYAQKCGPRYGVAQVFIIWSELDTQPTPIPLKQGSSKVEFLRMETNSLNTRFLPIPQLASTGVFMVDDDVRVHCSSLSQGFHAWTASPNSLVGYYPRLAKISKKSLRAASSNDNLNNQHWIYHNWLKVFLSHKLNIILTKACFLHKQYFDIYWDPQQHPKQILDFVDSHRNCEDIAMAMLVANSTGALPVYVQGSLVDKGVFGGISTGSGHANIRSDCITELTQIYLNHGWPSPLEKIYSLRKASWLHHAPDLWWLYRPSSIFEWLAVANSHFFE